MSNHGYAVGPSKRIELEGLESAAMWVFRNTVIAGNIDSSERYMQINQDALTSVSVYRWKCKADEVVRWRSSTWSHTGSCIRRYRNKP